MPDKQPPRSIEAEQGFLGCVLLGAMDEAVALEPKVTEEWFADSKHQKLWEIFSSMMSENKPIDMHTLMHYLAEKKLTKSIGGPTYLITLQDATPSAFNLPYWYDILREKKFARRAISGATRILDAAYTDTASLDLVVNDVENEIFSLSNENEQKEETQKESYIRIADKMQRAAAGEAVETGIRTHFQDYDEHTGGLQAGQLIILAARPGIGKTSFALNIVSNLVFPRYGEPTPVGIFSLEMTRDQLNTRMIGGLCKVNMRRIMQNKEKLSIEQQKRMAEVIPRLMKSPIVIDDRGGININQIFSRARRMVRKEKVKVIFIDYLQLVRGPKGIDKKNYEVGFVSETLKMMAKELNVAVFALAQMSRNFESQDRRPRLSDLKDSGNLEQDADVVGFLYPHNPEESSSANIVPVRLDLAKVREGESGSICELTFFKEYTLFETATRFPDTND